MFEIINSNGIGRGQRCGRDTKATLGFSSKGPTKKSKSKVVCFYVGVDLAKKARFIKGDRVLIMKDKYATPCMGLLKRTTVDDTRGRILGAGGISKNIYRLTITDSLNVFPSPAKGVISLENIVINDDGIYFDWPE